MYKSALIDCGSPSSTLSILSLMKFSIVSDGTYCVEQTDSGARKGLE